MSDNRSFTEKVKDTAHHAKEYVKESLGAGTSERRYPSDSTTDTLGGKGAHTLGKTKENLGISPSSNESQEQRLGRAETEGNWTKDSAHKANIRGQEILGMREKGTWEELKSGVKENYGKLKEKLGVTPSENESLDVKKGRAEQKWKDTKGDVKESITGEKTT